MTVSANSINRLVSVPETWGYNWVKYVDPAPQVGESQMRQ
jgi:hypothetical protein